ERVRVRAGNCGFRQRRRCHRVGQRRRGRPRRHQLR
ncbi:MAG: hypothetical protein AVDCRST_MAG59-1074, partial [uncultured Thermomicrobiales bacterium]